MGQSVNPSQGIMGKNAFAVSRKNKLKNKNKINK